MKNLTSRSAARRWFIDGLALAGVVTAATFMMASGAAVQAETTAAVGSMTWVIEIRYEGECPDLKHPPAMPKVDPGDHVSWKSVDSDGNLVKFKYSIYFDPFVGPPITTISSSGVTHPFTVNMGTPKYVEYKYTVVGVDSGGVDCQPLDPRLRVGR